MAGIKIVDLPALGRDLAATDLLELSLAGGTGSRKITGQEIINASKLNVGTTPIINGTAGRLLFQGSGDVLGQSGNLFWDNTNARLGVGIAVPTSKLHVKFNGALTSGIDIDSTAFNTNHLSFSKDGVMRGQIGMNDNSGEIRYFCGAGGYYPTFWSNNFERMRIQASTGNVCINTSTDAGFKLDVNGTGRFQNTLKLSNNITASTQNGYFEGNTAGNITNTTAVFNFQYPTSATTGTMFQFSDNLNTGYVSDLFGNKDILRVFGGFKNPNSAWVYSDIKIDPTYQGVGSGTIVRGIYYNPTNSLTGTYTLRAIETTIGNVIFNGGNVGIGTSTPTNPLDIRNADATMDMLRVQCTSVNGYSSIGFFNNAGVQSGGFGYGNASANALPDVIYFYSINKNILFNTNGGSNERMRIAQSSGNVLIGTTTDAGYRLDVNGTAIVRGILTINDNVQGKISADNQYLNLYHNGGTQSILSFGFGSSIGASGYLLINQVAGDPAGVTSGTIHRYDFNSTITNSSGTAQWNFQSLRPNYNFTGTYSGTVRGFYYNPTLTSMTGVTHFAFHSTSGRVRFEGLPTSPTGLNAGDIYNDGGILKIV